VTSARLGWLYPTGWPLGRRILGLLGRMELFPLRSLPHPVRDICIEPRLNLLDRQDTRSSCGGRLHHSILVSRARTERFLIKTDGHTSCINAFVVKWYGEAEFWLALGKVFLILIVYMFTFITMVGGNPKKDAYGFRYCKLVYWRSHSIYMLTDCS
jgi:hypothetical protein